MGLDAPLSDEIVHVNFPPVGFMLQSMYVRHFFHNTGTLLPWMDFFSL